FATCDVAYGDKRSQTKPSQWWLAILLPAALLVAAIEWNFALRAAGFRAFQVPSQAMAPAIPRGGHVLMDGHYYNNKGPQRGDGIVFTLPKNRGVYLVKRVIAVGGETISVEGKNVLIDGRLISEPYVHLEQSPYMELRAGPITLPPRKLFVMGDNRSVSLDSRTASFGLVDVSTVIGDVTY